MLSGEVHDLTAIQIGREIAKNLEAKYKEYDAKVAEANHKATLADAKKTKGRKQPVVPEPDLPITIAQTAVKTLNADAKNRDTQGDYPIPVTWRPDMESQFPTQQAKEAYQQQAEDTKWVIDSARKWHQSIHPCSAYNGQSLVDWSGVPRIEHGDRTGTWVMDKQLTYKRLLSAMSLSHELQNECEFLHG